MQIKFSDSVRDIKEMTAENKKKFTIQLKVPAFKVNKHVYTDLRRLLKYFTLDNSVTCRRYQNLDENDSLFTTHKYILLDPEQFSIDKIKPEYAEQIVESEYNFKSLVSSLIYLIFPSLFSLKKRSFQYNQC
jgi:hypothetical protein